MSVHGRHYVPAYLRTASFRLADPLPTAPAAVVHVALRDALKPFHDAVSMRPVEMTDDDWDAHCAIVEDIAALWSILLGGTLVCQAPPAPADKGGAR